MDRFPDRNELRILFSHAAYQMAHCFSLRNNQVSHSQAWSTEDTQALLPTADVLVVSGFWQNEYLDHANRLRYIQSIGAGYDQFPLDTLKTRGISLANATGVNADAVSQHAMGLILALYRQLHIGRDNQQQKIWRGMISDLGAREDDLCGHTVLIVGLGAIGNRLAALSKAFGMTVVGVKRNIDDYSGPADEVVAPEC
ncbi:MAG TPA: D-2-hydroxyacid dehydrogenase, partial [Gammaproteobacteria bacterium]|nr:D-2-hydroxyacid dehydrogenase [Gammaproteobacteria bacterium]